MLGAIFSLASLAPAGPAAPAERSYAGGDEVVAPDVGAAAPMNAAVPLTPRVPAPSQVPPPEPEPGPLPRQPKQEPTPKWWGPFPRPNITAFGGPIMQLTGLHGAFAATVGFGGGAWFRQRVGLGGMVMWLLNPSDAGTTALGAKQRLNINYGGLSLAVVVARVEPVSFTVEGLIGGGGACLQNPSTGSCFDKTALFLGQPGVGVHVRLAPIVRLALGAGYRLVAARGWGGPNSRQLGGPVGTVMLEFGLF